MITEGYILCNFIVRKEIFQKINYSRFCTTLHELYEIFNINILFKCEFKYYCEFKFKEFEIFLWLKFQTQLINLKLL